MTQWPQSRSLHLCFFLLPLSLYVRPFHLCSTVCVLTNHKSIFSTPFFNPSFSDSSMAIADSFRYFWAIVVPLTTALIFWQSWHWLRQLCLRILQPTFKGLALKRSLLKIPLSRRSLSSSIESSELDDKSIYVQHYES